MKTLETERLILRSWRPGDVNGMYEYARDPEVGPNAGWEPHADISVSAKIIGAFMEKDDVWAIELRGSGKVIGSIGIHEDTKRSAGINARMVGYVLSRDYWGRGLMTEAVRRVIRYMFEETGVDLLSICHYPHNARSRRVIEKCGFVYEGTIRRASRIYDGTIMDEVCYSITKEEYLNTIGKPMGNNPPG